MRNLDDIQLQRLVDNLLILGENLRILIIDASRPFTDVERQFVDSKRLSVLDAGRQFTDVGSHMLSKSASDSSTYSRPPNSELHSNLS